MSKEKLVPEIRFEGFKGEWEETTLGEVSEIRGGGTPSTSIPDYWDGDINWYAPAEINNQNYVKESKRKITELGLMKSSANILPVGTVLFTSRAGIGKTAILDKEGATNQGFQSIVPYKDKLDSYFIYSKTNDLKKYGEEKGAGSTFVEVSGKQMAKMPIMLPSLKEQKELGVYFKELDKLKLTKSIEIKQLQNFKQAMLQKMFPKEGEKEPEIRFEGFEGEWEKVQISEIGDVVTGNTPPTSDTSNYSNDGTIWVTPTDIKDNITLRTGKSLSKDGLLTARTVPAGSILVTCIASIGKNTLVLEEAGFNQQINAVIPKSDMDSYFLLTISNHWSNGMKRTAALGTMQIVNRKEFSKIKTMIPSYSEQKLIGEYFQTLDQNIQAKQKELEKLKQFKQAMLDKMFV